MPSAPAAVIPCMPIKAIYTVKTIPIIHLNVELKKSVKLFNLACGEMFPTSPNTNTTTTIGSNMLTKIFDIELDNSKTSGWNAFTLIAPPAAFINNSNIGKIAFIWFCILDIDVLTVLNALPIKYVKMHIMAEKHIKKTTSEMLDEGTLGRILLNTTDINEITKINSNGDKNIDIFSFILDIMQSKIESKLVKISPPINAIKKSL